MPRSKIIPVDQPCMAVDLADDQGATAFDIARELPFGIIDVLRDDVYVFSLCRMTAQESCWAIFQKSQAVGGAHWPPVTLADALSF